MGAVLDNTHSVLWYPEYSQQLSTVARTIISDRAKTPDFRAVLGEWAPKSDCAVLGVAAFSLDARGCQQSLTSLALHVLGSLSRLAPSELFQRREMQQHR
jgi:hypothetical protein